MAMRKIARNIARAKMRRAGLRHINKDRLKIGSYFSKHWREYANYSKKGE